MNFQEKQDLIKYRIERAFENFEAAQLLFDNEKFFNSVTAIYYSAFQIVLAVLLTKDISIKTHKSVLNNFSKYFIKDEIFPREFGRLLNKLMDYRSHADYADFVELTKEEVEDLLNQTKIFLDELNKYIQKSIN